MGGLPERLKEPNLALHVNILFVQHVCWDELSCQTLSPWRVLTVCSRREAGRKLVFLAVWMIRAPQHRSKIGSELNKPCARTNPSSWRLNKKAGLERHHQFKHTRKDPWPLHEVLGPPSLKQHADDGVQLNKTVIRSNRREKKNLSVCYLSALDFSWIPVFKSDLQWHLLASRKAMGIL